jgi:hypothetical protein
MQRRYTQGLPCIMSVVSRTVVNGGPRQLVNIASTNSVNEVRLSGGFRPRGRAGRIRYQAWLPADLPRAACAAASRAIGTR